ncbi:MAG: hypothetical protein IPG72_14525 [Ardenticatenales bacterium]|nr:hypothetical protein [Ardenticatenales bacterium]
MKSSSLSFGSALNVAADELRSSRRREIARPVVVLLSDGSADGRAAALEARMGRLTRGWEGLRLPGFRRGGA